MMKNKISALIISTNVGITINCTIFTFSVFGLGIILLSITYTPQANAYTYPITKGLYSIAKMFDNPQTLSKTKIKDLSRLSAKELGQHLGQLKLSNKVRPLH